MFPVLPAEALDWEMRCTRLSEWTWRFERIFLSFVANFCGCWPVWTESCYSSSFTAPPPYITLRDWTVHNSVLKLGLACWQWCFTHIWSFMFLLKLWNSVTFQLCSQSISKVSLIVFFFSKLYRRVGFPSIFDLKLIAL